ncbi:hypothetical protein C8Q76DRAFT_641209, partial [Earliella scabrosa]
MTRTRSTTREEQRTTRSVSSKLVRTHVVPAGRTHQTTARLGRGSTRPQASTSRPSTRPQAAQIARPAVKHTRALAEFSSSRPIDSPVSVSIEPELSSDDLSSLSELPSTVPSLSQTPERSSSPVTTAVVPTHTPFSPMPPNVTAHLPPVGDKKALTFNGHNVDDFIVRLEELAHSLGVPDAELPKAVLKYASKSVRQTLIAEQSFSGIDWSLAKQRLKLLYETMNDAYETSPKRLRSYVDNARQSKYVKSRARLTKYHLGFLQRAGGMVSENVMGSTEHNHLFYSGLPHSLRNAIRTELSLAVMKRTTKQMSSKYPPTVDETMEAARAYYAADELNDAAATDISSTSSDSSSSSSHDDSSSSDSSSDSSGPDKRTKGKNRKKPKTKKPRKRTKSASDSELQLRGQINALAQQVKTLALAIHQDRTVAPTTAPSTTPVQQHVPTAPYNAYPGVGGQLPPTQYSGRKCWMCGKYEGAGLAHPINMKNCPETQRLLREGRIAHHPLTGRIVHKDLSELPTQTPYGIATYLDGLVQNPGRDQPPHLSSHQAVTHSIGLLRNGVPVVSYQPEDRDAHDVFSYPALTRAQAKQKDTTEAEPSKASTAPTLPATTTSNDKAQSVEDSAGTNWQPPKINTEEGWKAAQRSHQSGSHPKFGTKPSVRFTSDVQDSISVDSVQETLLSTRVELSLREILAVAPTLQKRLGALVKVRREHDSSARTTAEAAAVVNEPTPSFEATLSFEQGSELLDDLMERYAASVALGQPRQYAMVSGLCEGVFGDQAVTFLVDTGSELNLINQEVWKRTTVDIDRDGA